MRADPSYGTRIFRLVLLVSMVGAAFVLSTLPRAVGDRGAYEARPREGIVRLALGSLQRQSRRYAPQRDIFHFEANQDLAGAGSKNVENAGEQQRARAEPEAGAVSRPPPRLSMDLLGVFGTPELRIAVFKDATQGIVNALEKDVIDGRFLVHRIDEGSVEMAFVDRPRQARLHVPVRAD